MKPCERTGDVSLYSTATAESVFPDSQELSNRPAVTFRGVVPDAVVRSDAGVATSAPGRIAPDARADRPPRTDRRLFMNKTVS